MKNLAIIIMFIACLSCKTEEEAIYDSTGVATKLPHVWRINLTDNEKELVPIVTNSNSIYKDNKVLCSGYENKERYLYYLDCQEGKNFVEME